MVPGMKPELQRRVLFALSNSDPRIKLTVHENGSVFSSQGKVGYPQKKDDPHGYRKVTVWTPLDLSSEPSSWRQKKIGKKVNRAHWVKSEIYEHQIIWLNFNGEIPAGKSVDHKNRKKYDNSITNLKLSDDVEQGENQNRGANRHLIVDPSLRLVEIADFNSSKAVYNFTVNNIKYIAVIYRVGQLDQASEIEDSLCKL